MITTQNTDEIESRLAGLKARVMTGDEMEDVADRLKGTKVKAEIEAARQRFVAANFPRRHVTTETKPHPESDEIAHRISERIGSGALLAMVGPRGTGKTQIATRLGRDRCQTGSVLYVKMRRFFMAFKDAYKSESLESTVFDSFIRPGLLVVDESHERTGSRWEDGLLTSVIDERYDNGRDTILISNLTPDEFRQEIGESISSRLNETGGVIECKWESFRT